MIWLTWRQSRVESLIGGAALALVAVFLLWTGHNIISSYHDAGLPSCVATHASDDGCLNAAAAFFQRFNGLSNLTGWLNLLPFLLGLLLAAPTVLELEHGTYRLAWTQSVTRRRWLLTRIAYGLAIAIVAAAALVALWTWWLGPIDALKGKFNGNSFDFEGTAPIAYTVFAFALCVAVGTMLRRTVPAVGIGLVGFLTARAAVSDRLRPHYLAPIKLTWDPTEPPPAAAQSTLLGSRDWILSQGWTGATGNGLEPANSPVRSCMLDTGSKGGDLFNQCLHDQGVVVSMVYHPASRFWTFQAIETAIFLGVAAALFGLTFWWVTRRIVRTS
jgi:hypothetical protein